MHMRIENCFAALKSRIPGVDHINSKIAVNFCYQAYRKIKQQVQEDIKAENNLVVYDCLACGDEVRKNKMGNLAKLLTIIFLI